MAVGTDENTNALLCQNFPKGTDRRVCSQDHLDAALASLDRIAPLDGPPDLQLWAWRIVDLRSVVASMDSRP